MTKPAAAANLSEATASGPSVQAALPKAPVVLATRKSALALLQTATVQSRLQQHYPQWCFQQRQHSTQGDDNLQVALHALTPASSASPPGPMGANKAGYGVFVKELEGLLLKGEATLAVHSLKDMPSVLPEGLAMVPVGPREDVRDVLITRAAEQTLGQSLEALPSGWRIGTASLRRQAALKAYRPDVQPTLCRGNLNTRLKKLEAGEVDALLLAAAGVHRLGWQHRISAYLDPLKQLVPAVGQGVLAVEGREDCPVFQQAAEALSDPVLQTQVAAERSLMRVLEGGCQLPLGGYCEVLPDQTYRLWAQLWSPDGQQCLEQTAHFTSAEDPKAVGAQVAEALLALGGVELKAKIRAAL